MAILLIFASMINVIALADLDSGPDAAEILSRRRAYYENLSKSEVFEEARVWKQVVIEIDQIAAEFGVSAEVASE